MKQIGKRVYNNNFFKYWGDTVPLKNNLSFYSKKRTGSTVVNKIDDTVNGELVYNPLTDVIDINDKVKYPRGDVIIDIKGHPWENVTLLTKLDDVIGNKTFKIVKNFDDFQAVDNGRSETDYYIMSNDIDCSKAQTEKITIATDTGVNSIPVWSEQTYTNGDMVKVQNNETGIYPIDSPEATPRYDIYRRTLYMTDYDNTISPELDTEEKYWHIYNYQGFWINEFKGVFSGNGFELQNCYVNKVTNYAGVFSQLSGGKLSNIGVTGSVIGYGANVGGLVGVNNSSSIITNSYSTGSVIGYGRSIGGLVGLNNSSSITNSYSTGSVIGYRFEISGLVGYNLNSSITNSYSTGSVIGYGIYMGGLVGVNNSSSIITNSYYSSLSGQTDIGKGLLVPDADMKGIDNVDTFVGWDFSNTWAIDDGYPYLRMQVDNLANPISNSRIVNNYDGYVLMPLLEIEIDNITYDIFNKYSPIYNADGDGLVNPTGSDYFVSDADEVAGTINRLWHVDELNTERITAYLATGFKFLWFVKNTFDAGTYTPTSVKEILAYDAPITDADDLNKIKTYIKYDWS